MNMNKMLQQAQKMQRDMEKKQSEIESSVFNGNISNGLEIEVYGNKSIKSLKINPEFVDTDDMEMLEDSIVSVYNKVLAEIENKTKTEMDKFQKGMGGGFPF